MKPLTLPVIAGRQHARRLGFRTLNFDLTHAQLPVDFGIYAGWVMIDEVRYRAAIHSGPRPALGDATPSLEAHLIDTQLETTPAKATVAFGPRLRAIRQFPNEQALRTQIANDVAAVRRHLPLSVYVFGAFDGIHPGHRSFLRQAQAYGESLTAVVARDLNIERSKSHRPRRPEAERLAAVQALGLADRVILGAPGHPYASLRSEPIDLICLGYDQHPTDQELRAELRRIGKPTVRIVRLQPFLPFLFHSRIVRRWPFLGWLFWRFNRSQ